MVTSGALPLPAHVQGHQGEWVLHSVSRSVPSSLTSLAPCCGERFVANACREGIYGCLFCEATHDLASRSFGPTFVIFLRWHRSVFHSVRIQSVLRSAYLVKSRFGIDSVRIPNKHRSVLAVSMASVVAASQSIPRVLNTSRGLLLVKIDGLSYQRTPIAIESVQDVDIRFTFFGSFPPSPIKYTSIYTSYVYIYFVGKHAILNDISRYSRRRRRRRRRRHLFAGQIRAAGVAEATGLPEIGPPP